MKNNFDPEYFAEMLIEIYLKKDYTKKDKE
jgi:hypothetical protein